MTTEPVKVGVVGCGNISAIYFKNGAKLRAIDIVACADLDMEKAKARAEEFEIAKACTPDELMADPEIEIVLNLTVPQAHYSVAMAAIEAGKSTYSEKPLTLAREEAAELLAKAEEKSVLVGCAPDTFLGGGIQTCRKLIDDGWIGKPLAADAFMMGRGPESWHTSPVFYYLKGGGPMFDMGPYYLTALVNLLGPVKTVAGMATMGFEQRTVTSEPLYGTVIDVEVPTHVMGLMEFRGGAVGTIITSFDTMGSQTPRIEIHGSEGSLLVPDPNTFGGPIKIKKTQRGEWQDVPLAYGYAENSRGIGVADMAAALRSGRAHRASGELAAHVLDIMHGFHDASAARRHVRLKTKCKRPAALPLGLRESEIDA